MRVSKFLKDARAKARLTQWDVARNLKFTTAQFVSNWERGVSYPSPDSYVQLAQVLRVPLKRLINVIYAEQEMKLKTQKKALLKQLGAA